MITHDCEPTLTDAEVMNFCREGYLVFEAVVPDEINQRTCEFLLPDDVTEKLLEAGWFVDNVLLNPPVAGVARSLLGSNFKLTMPFIFNHLFAEPQEPQGWHRDGSSHYGPELDSLQVFYYPQDTPKELGPTDQSRRRWRTVGASSSFRRWRCCSMRNGPMDSAGSSSWRSGVASE